MRVETAVGIYAGVEDQAQSLPWVRMRSTKSQANELTFSSPLGSRTGSCVFHNRHVGVHAGAIHPHDGLGQETRRQSHLAGDLTTDQFIKLDLIGGGTTSA